jgi:hypothetical protein
LPFAALLLLFRLEGRSEGIPAFAPPTIDAQGQVHVALLDDSATSYVIDVSTNLTDWSPVLTNTTLGGRLELTQTLDRAARFYRARIDPAAGDPPPAVIAFPDPSQQTVGFVTPDGGDLTLLNESGVLYTLSFPTNAVSEPVQVSMTLVTNLVGQPFADTNWNAVVFEPSGLEFLSPALLTIQYLYESPPTNLASFWFSGDGTDFGLIPEQVYSNRVEFPVYHFSGFGGAKMSSAEIQLQAQRRVNNRLDNLNQSIAQELKQLQDAGQVPIPGENLPPDVRSRMSSYLDAYFQNLLAYGPRLMSDCNFLLRMIPQIMAGFAIESRYKLTPKLDAALIKLHCDASERCARKIAVDCKNGNTDVYQRVRKWEFATMIPSHCTPIPDSELKDCLPVWYGTFDYHEDSSWSQNSGSPAMGSYFLTGRGYHLSVRGVVTNATELPPNPFVLLSVTLGVTADVQGDYMAVDFTDAWGGCEGHANDPMAAKRTSNRAVSGAGETNGSLTMTLYQFTNTPLGVNFVPPSPFRVYGRGSHHVFQTDCSDKVLTNATVRVTEGQTFDVPGFTDSNPVIQITTNEIKMRYQVSRWVDLANETVTGTWEVDLKRRPK